MRQVSSQVFCVYRSRRNDGLTPWFDSHVFLGLRRPGLHHGPGLNVEGHPVKAFMLVKIAGCDDGDGGTDPRSEGFESVQVHRPTKGYDLSVPIHERTDHQGIIVPLLDQVWRGFQVGLGPLDSSG